MTVLVYDTRRDKIHIAQPNFIAHPPLCNIDAYDTRQQLQRRLNERNIYPKPSDITLS